MGVSETDVMVQSAPASTPGALPDTVPARMINEVLYCERLLYLEWAQGEFADNVFTVDGNIVHRRADEAGGRLPPKPATAARPTATETVEKEAGELPYHARSVWLSSERLGITAKIDVVDGDAAGTVVPIEYKRGEPPDVPEGAWLPERAQLCAQVLLLRDHGYRCDEAAIYFAGARRRVRIDINDALIETTLGAARRARTVAGSGQIPPPLVDSPKCNGCSLVGICLPDETNFLHAESAPSPAAVVEEIESEPPDERVLRRLHPARDDRVPLYVQEQGARIGLSGECLVVKSRDGNEHEARLGELSHVTLLGNVQMSTQALRTLLERNIPVTYSSTGGWLYGHASSLSAKNVELRLAQMRAATDRARCLAVASRLVATKIRNCRTLLRRNATDVPPGVLADLERLAARAAEMQALDGLLGIEGTAARSYFAHFSRMLKPGDATSTFDFDGRNRRPPRDPVNALLSLAYSLLAKEFVLALTHVGLDPMLGFYHQLRFGRPALALDLMEEFRPLVADSIVVGAINTGVVGERDFIRHPTGVALTDAGRRHFIQAYERRMDQLVTHPVFGYRISYRRVLEVQARLLTRFLLGEIDEYPEFRTR